jgi:uncharacterized cofD-like protein
MATKYKAINSLSQLDKVVAIGGGTGLGRLLSSLSYLGNRLTGVVATTDNGGSTGRLREETGCIAWGDLRNCLGQLSNEQDIKKLLFDYRFDECGNLSGHSLGNLMLLALDNMCVRPQDTINMFRQFLNVEPQIHPMTEMPAHLTACDENGCNVFGEVNIDSRDKAPLSLQITPAVQASDEVIEAITQAELILLGPGSFFTSILPPLLVPNIRDAIVKSEAPKYYIASMAPELGAAGNLNLQQKTAWFDNYVCPDLIDLVIWPESRKRSDNGSLLVLEKDLFNEDNPRLHEMKKLANAIEHAYRHFSQRYSNAS